MSFIKNLDRFGVFFNLGLSSQQTQYKTRIGGLCSLVIYLIALFYFCFVTWQWLIDRQMLPKIIQTNQFSDYSEISLEENIITFSLLYPYNQDPFEPNRNIISPAIFEINNEKMNQVPLKDNLKQNRTNPDSIYSVFELRNYTLSYSSDQPDNKKPLKGLMVLFAICDPLKSLPGTQCAPQEEIDTFFQQLNSFQISITLNQFNVKTRKMDKFTKIYYPLIDGTNTVYHQIILKTGEAQLFEGFLIAEEKKQQYLYSSDLITQTVSQKYFEGLYKLKLCSSVLISLDSLKQITAIQYPLLGEVMAQVSSILSMLMLTGIIINLINSSELENYLTDEIIGFYYPQFKKLKIKRNFQNKITSLKSNDEKIEYQIDKFGKVYEKARKTAINKLNILNIIYEISRIQFVLQSLQEKQYILRSHNVGIKFKLQQKSEINQVKPDQSESQEIHEDGSIQYQQDQKLLNDQDMQLLCFNEQDLKQYSYELEEQQSIKQNLFYDENDMKERMIRLNC